MLHTISCLKHSTVVGSIRWNLCYWAGVSLIAHVFVFSPNFILKNSLFLWEEPHSAAESAATSISTEENYHAWAFTFMFILPCLDKPSPVLLLEIVSSNIFSQKF